MFQPSDQILYFASTDLCGGELEGSLTGKRAMGSCEPRAHLVEVTFEELECEADEPSEADQAIRLLRLKPFGVLAPGQGPSRDLKELCGPGCREVENPPEPFECLVGEALTNSGVELSGLVGSKAQKRNVGVGALRVIGNLAPESVDGFRSGSLSAAHDAPPCKRMAKYKLPYGITKEGQLHNEALNLTRRSARRR